MKKNTSPVLPEAGFLQLKQVLTLIPISQASWYAGVKSGRFPQPVKIGPRTAAYRAEDIRILIENLQSGEIQKISFPGDIQKIECPRMHAIVKKSYCGTHEICHQGTGGCPLFFGGGGVVMTQAVRS